MAAPLRVGILNDMSEGPPGPADNERWLRLGVDELVQSGRIDREVEFVHAWGLGLPSGTAAAVERAYAALVEQDVLLIVGPAIGDNALVATPLAERDRVPTINWAGAERARGEYMFQLQVGSHEDESIVLARHLVSLGVGRVGVVYDRSPIGRRHLHFLLAEAEVVGLQIAATASRPPLTEDAAAAVDPMLAGGADALVYLGLGLSAPAVARAATARGWVGPRAMNTAGLRGYDPEFARSHRRLDLHRHALRSTHDPGGLAQPAGRRRQRSPICSGHGLRPRPPRRRRAGTRARAHARRGQGRPGAGEVAAGRRRATRAPCSGSASTTGAPCMAAIWCCASGSMGDPSS